MNFITVILAILGAILALVVAFYGGLFLVSWVF